MVDPSFHVRCTSDYPPAPEQKAPRIDPEGLNQPSSSRSVLSGSERYIVLGARPHHLDLFDQVFEILLMLDEVDLIGIDDQQRCRRVVKEKMVIGCVHVLQIRPFEFPLGGSRSRLNSPDQDIRTRLQIEDKVRFDDARLQKRLQPLIERQFVVVKRQIREDLILDKQIVADQRLLEEIDLGKLLLLAEPVQEVIELGLKGVPTHVGIESNNEGIFIRTLQQRSGLQALRQQLGQARLSDTDRAFDYDVPRFKRTADHGLILSRPYTCPAAVVNGRTTDGSSRCSSSCRI